MQSGKVVEYYPELRTVYVVLESLEKTFQLHVSISVRDGYAYASGIVNNRGLRQNTVNGSFVINQKVGGVQRKAYQELEKFMDGIEPKEMATIKQIETIKGIANSGRYNETEQRQILGQLDRLTKEKADRLISRLNSQ